MVEDSLEGGLDGTGPLLGQSLSHDTLSLTVGGSDVGGNEDGASGGPPEGLGTLPDKKSSQVTSFGSP